MDRLQADDLLAEGRRVDLLRNQLAVIAAADVTIEGDPFAWLARGDGRLVIGDPESVPAGSYARDWLQATGRWDGLQSRLVTASDVRAVRSFVERGEAALGVVYRSDVVGAPGVRSVGGPTAGQQPRIVYPAAVTRLGGDAARKALDFIRGPEATAIFTARGFEVIA